MFAIPDGAAAFFFACFLFGLIFIVVSAALGLAHDVTHIPGIDHGGVTDSGTDIGHGVDHGAAHGGDSATSAESTSNGHLGNAASTLASHTPTASPFNLMTVMSFLTWFGATGYVLDVFFDWALVPAVLAAFAAGGLAGWLVYLFLVRVLLPGTTPPPKSDYTVVGSIGRVTQAIPLNGTGEIVYTLGGARHGDGARTMDGEPLARETEVVIVKVEKGIAYVQSFESLRDDDTRSRLQRPQPSPKGIDKAEEGPGKL